MKRITIFTATLIALVGLALGAWSQTPIPPPMTEAQYRSSAELDQLLGPIALYPDPLIAEVLPAATLPSEIVLADRYVSSGGDPNQIDRQPVDPSVQALARYPEVLKMMDDNLAWTTDLGQAFLNQQQDVMDSIQRLRAQAQALGNLQTTPQENVITDSGAIEIVPAEPLVIYVPVYQPEVVYYQRAYNRPFISFGRPFAIGMWLDHDFDWHSHNLIEWGHEHPRPADWWSRRPSERPRTEIAQASVWRPRNQPAISIASRGDRGWGTAQSQRAAAPRDVQRTPAPREAQRTPAPRDVQRAPAPREAQPAPAPREIQSTPARQAPPRAPAQRDPQPTPVPREAPRTPAPRQVQPTPAPRPTPQPVRVTTPRPSSGALIGIQSTRDTQQFSSRGQQSRQVMNNPASAARPAASPSSAHGSTPADPRKH